MTKTEIEKEATSLKEKLNTIEEKARMSAATSRFLCQQASKLMSESNRFDLPFERREQLAKEMEALKGRMASEVAHVHDDDKEMERIYQRIVQLQEMYKETL